MRHADLPPTSDTAAMGRSEALVRIAKVAEDLAVMASGIEAPSLVHLLSAVLVEARELQEEERQAAAFERLP